jgi:hypothetical protein
MSAAARYHIVDEPSASPIAHLAVRPLWPLLALMIGGPWLAFPWFAVNAVALGAPARGRTYAWVAAAMFGPLGLAAALGLAREAWGLSSATIPWEVLAFVVWKLAVAYVLFEQQAPTAELFVHFGGRLRNGSLVVLGAYFFDAHFVHQLVDAAPRGIVGDLVYVVLR